MRSPGLTSPESPAPGGAMRTLVAAAALLALPLMASAQAVLLTPRFNITVIGCEEGHVSCDDVKYIGPNRRTGATIRLMWVAGGDQHRSGTGSRTGAKTLLPSCRLKKTNGPIDSLLWQPWFASGSPSEAAQSRQKGEALLRCVYGMTRVCPEYPGGRGAQTVPV
jgi:hypothetical protein